MKTAEGLFTKYSISDYGANKGLNLMTESFFSLALAEHDAEIAERIREMIDDNKAKADYASTYSEGGNKVFFYDTKVIALTEVLEILK